MKKTRSERQRGMRSRTWTAAALLAAWLFAATAADAQRLWNVGEVSRAPGDLARAQQFRNVGEVSRAAGGPGLVVEGVRVGPGGGLPGKASAARPAMAAEIEVTFDYLRLGMGYLELPLPDGSTIEAENAVFEDRGGGNLMWTGEVPGAGYESVLFTVQDGHLVGWFGEPGGPKYVVYAGPDGRGSLAEEAGPTGDWCGAGEGPGRDLARDVAVAAARRVSVASPSSADRLDILLLYTTGTERFWRVIGGPAVGVRQLGDYLNMVFRNGAISTTANLIPVRWDPKLANHPRTQGFHFRDRRFGAGGAWHWELENSPEVASLRKRHKADLFHFIPAVGTHRASGAASLRTSLNPYVLAGWSTPYPGTFAHEIGHNLGGNHEPVTFGDGFEEWQSRLAEHFRPYAFGHTDLTSCAKREGHGDVLYCPSTIMSYGQDTWDDPERFAFGAPFYSSVRHKPNGWKIGLAGTSEVERLFHETAPVAASSGEAPWRAQQYPRRVIGARWTGHDTVRVAWSGDWRSQDGGRARLALAEGADDVYSWSWDRAVDRDDPPLRNGSAPNVAPIVRAGGVQVGVEVSGLRPGGRYRLAVEGPWLYDADTNTWTPSQPSDVFHLKPRGRVSGSPAAASQIGARVIGPDSVRLHWRDNSGVEDGYEVWYRKWSGEKPDEVWSRYGEPLPARTRYLDVDGLAAEEEVQVTYGYWDYEKDVWVPGQKVKRGRYSFVVVAYNDKGWNASKTFDLEFMPRPHPEPTTAGDVTDCLDRETGIDLDGYRVWACLETPDGARRRAWDYRLGADQSGLLYFFDRDNAEILVKVLDGCAINGHRWVFVAPVTTLAFKLFVLEPGPYIENRRRWWYYDSERRPQGQVPWIDVGNAKDRTARTVSDTTAFPCTTAEIAAAKAASAGNVSGPGFASLGAAPLPAGAGSAPPLIAGARTDCVPGGPTLTLRGGYTVSMCYETYDGKVGDARDWGLDSSQSGLMYFFERNNAEVLIKVLDGCGVNGHRWVFVAPVTDLAFNLVVESPSGERWTHANRLGRTADAASDVSAFPCASAA